MVHTLSLIFSSPMHARKRTSRPLSVAAVYQPNIGSYCNGSLTDEEEEIEKDGLWAT